MTKLSRLLREAAGSHRDFCIDQACDLNVRLLAEADRLDAGPQHHAMTNTLSPTVQAFNAGWLAACGGESE